MDPGWWWVLAVMFGVGICAWAGMRMLDAVGRRVSAESPILGVLRRVTRKPAFLLAPLLAWSLVLSSVPDELPGVTGVRRLMTVSIIFSMTWLLIRAVQAMAEMVALLRPSSQSDNLSARRLHTQTRIISRTLASIIGMLGIALALMTFPQVRHLGASLLASAGLAGIVAGLAARPLLANFIAGIQIGLTQPIRLDDVVIVEGEWGASKKSQEPMWSWRSGMNADSSFHSNGGPSTPFRTGRATTHRSSAVFCCGSTTGNRYRPFGKSWSALSARTRCGTVGFANWKSRMLPRLPCRCAVWSAAGIPHRAGSCAARCAST